MDLISFYVMNILKNFPFYPSLMEWQGRVNYILLYYFWFFYNFFRFLNLFIPLVLNDQRTALDEIKPLSFSLVWAFIFNIIHFVIIWRCFTAVLPLWCPTAVTFIFHLYLYFLWTHLWLHLYYINLRWRRAISDVKNHGPFITWGLIERFFEIVYICSPWLR